MLTELNKEHCSNRERAAGIILLLSNLIFFLTVWLGYEYDQVRFDQILFQLKTTSAGVHTALLGSAVLWIGVFSAAVMLLEVMLYRLIAGKSVPRWQRLRSILRLLPSGFTSNLKKRVLYMAAVMLAFTVFFFITRLDLYRYVKTAATESDFIQEYYVEPGSITLRFPENKRNLIYIFLESMESTYADPIAGEQITTCYIPELKKLAEDHLNFSRTTGVGGALSYPGTTWTAAAMVAQTSGTIVKVSLEADSYGAEDSFLPGLTSIGEILAQQGYQQVLLVGSNAEFHGREAFFEEHGNYTILDTEALKAGNRLAQDYEQWWGFEDAKLFAYAKEELLRLAAEEKPFNFTMLTADTHFPDGYRCALCKDVYETQYANVLACSSRQVAEFIAWIQNQPFYDNTTIVISGDHLTMDAAFMEGIDPAYIRTVYNCFINAASEPVREKERQFGSFDLFPTTLAALGIEIEGDRLALGTNLFADRETLTEQFGYAYLTEELLKHSQFYNEKLLQITRRS